MAVKLSCFKCGVVEVRTNQFGIREACACGEDLHVCRNCEHYDPKVCNECRETVAEVVRDKERSNFCEHFLPTVRNLAGESDGTTRVIDKKEALRLAAEALFKKK